MKVAQLHLQQFMSHEDTRVQLPETGLVLVTGQNGSGKSSIVEAVSAACWGKTIRGTKPWSGKGASVEVTLDGVEVKRTPSKLFFGKPGALTAADTPTKTQELLDRTIPDRGVWLRASVFSSSDAETFSRATDGERKRLLESLLGLDKLDAALDACRAELRTARHTLATRTTEAAVQREQLAGFQARVNDAKEATEAARAAKGQPTQPLGKVRLRLGKVRTELTDLEAERSELRTQRGALQERIRAAGDHDVSGDTCSTCGQAIAEAHRRKVVKAQKAARETSEKALREVDERLDAVTARMRTAQERLEQLRRAEVVAQASEAATERLARAEAKLALLRDQVADAQDALDDTEGLRDRAQRRVRLLEAAEKVLGLQGVRAHLLGEALAGIEHVSNVWLSRIAATGDADLRLTLQPYSEGGKGTTKDAISLRIEGAAGGDAKGDYRGASNGERRRIDVALVLALGEVAAAAHGIDRGTLFFDEVFDALDVDGVMAVAEIIDELARNTCVVLISHNRELQRRLSPAMTLEVRKGVVRVR